jgi:hypothetical protein
MEPSVVEKVIHLESGENDGATVYSVVPTGGKNTI